MRPHQRLGHKGQRSSASLERLASDGRRPAAGEEPPAGRRPSNGTPRRSTTRLVVGMRVNGSRSSLKPATSGEARQTEQAAEQRQGRGRRSGDRPPGGAARRRLRSSVCRSRCASPRMRPIVIAQDGERQQDPCHGGHGPSEEQARRPARDLRRPRPPLRPRPRGPQPVDQLSAAAPLRRTSPPVSSSNRATSTVAGVMRSSAPPSSPGPRRASTDSISGRSSGSRPSGCGDLLDEHERTRLRRHDLDLGTDRCRIDAGMDAAGGRRHYGGFASVDADAPSTRSPTSTAGLPVRPLDGSLITGLPPVCCSTRHGRIESVDPARHGRATRSTSRPSRSSSVRSRHVGEDEGIRAEPEHQLATREVAIGRGRLDCGADDDRRPRDAEAEADGGERPDGPPAWYRVRSRQRESRCDRQSASRRRERYRSPRGTGTARRARSRSVRRSPPSGASPAPLR